MAVDTYVRNDVSDVSSSNVQGGGAGLENEVLVARMGLAHAADSLVGAAGGGCAGGGGKDLRKGESNNRIKMIQSRLCNIFNDFTT